MQSTKRRCDSFHFANEVVVTVKMAGFTYRDLADKQLVQEASRKLTPVQGEWRRYLSRGVLRQHLRLPARPCTASANTRAGVWNYRGEAVDISQDNTKHRGAFSSFKQRLRYFLEQCCAQAVSTTACRITMYISPKLRMSSTIIFLWSRSPIKSLPVIASYRQAPMFR